MAGSPQPPGTRRPTVTGWAGRHASAHDRGQRLALQAGSGATKAATFSSQPPSSGPLSPVTYSLSSATLTRPAPCESSFRMLPSWVTATRAPAAAGSRSRTKETPDAVGHEPALGDDLDDRGRGPPLLRQQRRRLLQQRTDPWRVGPVHDRGGVEADGRGRDRQHERQQPAPTDRHRHRHPTAGRDVPGLPAAGSGRDVQPPADRLKDDPAGSGLPRRHDVAEDRERAFGDPVPDLLRGQPILHGWPPPPAAARVTPAPAMPTCACCSGSTGICGDPGSAPAPPPDSSEELPGSRCPGGRGLFVVR